MKRGPQSGRSSTDHPAKARIAWGDPPDWIVALAEACAGASQSAIAKKLDYSPATISQILSNTYRGDVDRVEQMVRGVLMSQTIECPALGQLAQHTCLEWQGKPYAATSSHRVQMYRACRDGCPHSRISIDRGDDDAF